MTMRARLLMVAMLLGFAPAAMAQEAAPAPEPAPTTTVSAETTTSSDVALQKRIEVALLLGYGVGFDTGNIYGFGLGARGGYKITDKFYLGGRLSYNFGEDHLHMFMIGAEAGYDIPVATKLTLRPEIGLGIAVISVSVDTGFGTVSASDTDLYISLGGALLYDVTDSIFVGLHVDLPIVLASSGSAGLTFLATAGMRF